MGALSFLNMAAGHSHQRENSAVSCFWHHMIGVVTPWLVAGGGCGMMFSCPVDAMLLSNVFSVFCIYFGCNSTLLIGM